MESATTGCCVVGAGPAGVVLSLLLARTGIAVTLLEAHRDFDRDFRGDTLHPSVLEVIDQLGLVERLMALPHTRIERLDARVAGSDRSFLSLDFRGLRSRFPYLMMMPQARFLAFLVEEASRLPSFTLRLGAPVQELIQGDDGRVLGVRHRDGEGLVELRAPLVVGCDGRFSRVRKLAGIEPVRRSAPQDILWLRLARRPDDVPCAIATYGRGWVLILLDRGDHWQVGLVITKGDAKAVRARGLEALGEALTATAPPLAERLAPAVLESVGVLSVEASRVPTWWREGLLLIGDAAHVMSPVAGVGINYAVQDAVAAANLLWRPLREGRAEAKALRAVQRRREWPTRFVQRAQDMFTRILVAAALRGEEVRLPWPARVAQRLPLLRRMPVRMLAFGVRRERVSKALLAASH